MRSRAHRRERGSTSVQVLVILVPVFFGFMGFGIDLGRLYLARGEVKSAANAMALAAAAQLIGTGVALENAGTAARFAIDNTGGFANRYDFGGVVIGEGSGRLASVPPEPTYYETVGAATEEGEGESGTGSEAGGTTARHVRVDITADAPLIFWGFLTLGQERKTPVAARAVAGISAPLCTACGIEPIAIAPLTAEDTDNFGFTVNERYTFGYMCNGSPQPSGLAGATQRVPYLLLNRYNEEATLFPEESSQAYRIGAGGLPSTTNQSRSCVNISTPELIWTNAAPLACSQNRVAEVVTAFTCGLYSRFDATVPAQCEAITEVSTMASAFTPDTDVAGIDDWTAYIGNTRRVITVAIVESLSSGAEMTILAFRQFVVQPGQDSNTMTPADNNGRFIATYIGSPVPLRQGSFSGCTLTAGPGKVVLWR